MSNEDCSCRMPGPLGLACSVSQSVARFRDRILNSPNATEVSMKALRRMLAESSRRSSANMFRALAGSSRRQIGTLRHAGRHGRTTVCGRSM